MPAHEPIILPDGWQVVQRSDGWWLQRRIVGSELWIDARGPVKQRIQAVRAYERAERKREQQEERDTMATHDTSVYLAYRLLGDGRVIGVLPLLLGQAQIVTGRADQWTYSDEWMYATTRQALAAFSAWDGAPETEPLGWTRHKPSSRRRSYDESGNVAAEEVRE